MVKSTLAVGVRGEGRYVITSDMSPPWLRVKILSTGSMVELIEQTCIETAQAHLPEHEGTVGVHINVSRSATAMAGDEVLVRCQLEVLSGQRLTWRVTVTGPKGKISEGTHQRAIVDLLTFPII